MNSAQTNSGMQVIDKVKDYVMRNYKNPEISLTSAAEFASVSTGYLSGLFKKEAGTNFVKYLTDVRMEKSMQLLRSTDMKTYEIAYETGFPILIISVFLSKNIQECLLPSSGQRSKP